MCESFEKKVRYPSIEFLPLFWIVWLLPGLRVALYRPSWLWFWRPRFARSIFNELVIRWLNFSIYLGGSK